MRTFLRWCLLGLCIAFAGAHEVSAVPVLSGTTLIGATGVKVGDAFYDVSFGDGSCDSLYHPCSSASFVFGTELAARDASQALIASVFVDGALGDFDTDPGLTRGCEGALVECDVRTPYALALDDPSVVLVIIARNGKDFNMVQKGDFGVGDGTDDVSQQTYAVWSLAPNAGAVPEPGTILCLGIAGLALILTRCKRPRTRSHTQ